jgi:L-fuconolactonase
MTRVTGEPRPYPHPHVDAAWLDQRHEDILEPDLPIVDAHHHLWERESGRYLLEELRTDLGAGHNVRATVFIQCGYAYRSDGPPELRPVGETERVAAIAESAVAAGMPGVCAGIVGYCDFRLGDRVDAVLEAHIAAGAGRFRGIRQSAGWDAAIVSTTSALPPRGLLADPAFRSGLARLDKLGLSYECSLYHPQLPELTDLARAFPGLPILANHCGGPIRIGPYADDVEAAFLVRGVARVGGLPQRDAEVGRPGDDHPRVQLARSAGSTLVGGAGGGMAANHGDVHRNIWGLALYVRK